MASVVTKSARGCSSMCGFCPSCVFAPPRPGCTRVLWKPCDDFRRRFVTALLLRCGDAELLRSIQRALGITRCKLFTYARSRCPTPPSTTNHHHHHPTPRPPSGTPLGVDWEEIWNWFDRSPNWIRSSYLCRIFLLCDAELLRMASNLTSVLLVRDRCGLVLVNGEVQGPPEEDPALLVVPGSSKSFSGVSRYKDFISCLPGTLSKRILGLLEEATLNVCEMVCRHWQRLALETSKELEFRRSFQNKIKATMKRRNLIVSPSFANVVDVLVPIKEDVKDGDAVSTRPKVWAFEAAYGDVRTRTVQMEERNVYCGSYFAEVLMDEEDPRRVLGYDGGSLMAATWKDRGVRLHHVASKTRGAVLRGHAGRVGAVLLRQDRDALITGSSDATIRCWSLKTETCERVLRGHTGAICCLDLDADTLVSGARDRLVKVWSLGTGTSVNGVTFKHPSPVVCVKVAVVTLCSGCEGGHVRVWDLQETTLLRVVNVHSSSVKCLFLDDFHFLCGDSSGKVTAWSKVCATEESLVTFKHPQEVMSVTLVFLRAVTACVDGKIRIFNFLTGECLKTIVVEADAAACRLLSTHFTENRLLVNTSASVKLYQFVDVLREEEKEEHQEEEEENWREGSRDSRKGVAHQRIQDGQEPRSRTRQQRQAGGRRCVSGGESLLVSERAAMMKRRPLPPRSRDSRITLQKHAHHQVRLDTSSNSQLGEWWGSQEPPLQKELHHSWGPMTVRGRWRR